MNCFWLIILLLLCENCGSGAPGRKRREPYVEVQETLEREARYEFEQPPRGFAGFPASETCGCENSEGSFPNPQDAQ